MRDAVRKLLATFALAVALLATVVLARAMRTGPRTAGAARAVGLPEDPAAAERLAGALRFRTVSHADPALFGRDEFLRLHAYLEASFPRAHAELRRESVGELSLLYTWQGSEASLEPMLLMGHLDVVPVEPGTEGAWTQPPFSGAIADGFVWGRGAGDDKGSVLAILEAVEALLAEGFRPRRTLLLAFGHDEELGGFAGAARIAALLRERGVRLESVLDEGSVVAEGILPGLPRPVALVGTTEKGYLTVELRVEAAGGHSSMPPVQTAIGILAAAVARLEARPLPARLEGTARAMFERLAPEMPFGPRLALANLWLFRPLVERQLAGSPVTNAFIRTTTAVTIIEGGVKDNVLPTRARAAVNFRIRPGESVAEVMRHVRQAVADERVTVAQRGPAVEPAPESDRSGPSFARLAGVIESALPGVVVAPYPVIGATDSRHFVPLTRNVYRFLPLRAGPEDLKRYHGSNERISLANYRECVAFYRRLLSAS